MDRAGQGRAGRSQEVTSYRRQSMAAARGREPDVPPGPESSPASHITKIYTSTAPQSCTVSLKKKKKKKSVVFCFLSSFQEKKGHFFSLNTDV